ncbi:MAG: CotH kinase family protein [Verrucomicrobia bacterium]|nr:CotH kinase family protein [Verrucomicrobiota bacterium]
MPRSIQAVLGHACLLAAILPAVLPAASFTHNFNSVATDTPNGAINTNLTLSGGSLNGAAANVTLISNRKDTNGAGTINVGIVKTGVGSGGATALRLADKATGSATAALVLPVLDANATVTEFTVTLRLLLDRTAGATPADGFNISFGPALSGVGGAGGHLAAYGLIVNFDTYQNATNDPRSIEVFADGNSVGNFLASNLPGGNFTYDQTFRELTLHWDVVNGLDLTYGGTTIFSKLPTPGFIPTVGGNFAINAGTGGLMHDVFIDDLAITTVTTPVAPPQTGGVVIEEIMADNNGGLEDEDLDRPDWIDLYNGTAAAVSLAGWRLDHVSAPVPAPGTTPAPASYALPNNLTIPAYGHVVIFASGKNRFTNVRPHANFTLQKEGGTLTLVRADGTTAAHSLAFGPQQQDVAFGGLGAAQTPGYLETPTPGAANAGRQAAGRRLGAPVFFKPGVTPRADQPSAVLTSAISLGLQLPEDAPAGAEIRYTLNTAEPTETSPRYTAPLDITTGTCVKARVFAPDHLPSKTGNRAFIWLSSAADTSATTLINVASNYAGSGRAFSSNLPVLVLDSFLRNVDGLTNPAGLRPYRFTQVAVYDVQPGTNRASLAGPPDQMLRGGTHVRGQSSSGQAERPYALELWKEDEDADRTEPLLGMPSDADWVLMTLTLDKSLMRNYLMQQAMLDANGPGAGVRCRFVEVFFNQGNTTLDYADYRGVYLLMEKVSRGKERVDVAKLNDSMSDPALINGGFIFKNDKTPYEYRINAAANAAIPGANRDYDIFDPEPVTATQAGALVDWLNRLTTALAAADFNQPASANYYAKWLHERSFIDKTLFLELCKEVDAYTFSYYFSKDRNGPLTAFPLWDVDRSLGNSDYGSSNATFGMKWWVVGGNYTYYTRLHQDAEFNDRYWNRWTALRRSHFAKEKLFERIESVYTLLTDGSRADIVNAANATTMAVQVPVARHYRKYPILGALTFSGGQTGQATRTTWRHEVDALKSWLAERLEWIDGAPQPIDANRLAERLKPTDLINVATGQPLFGGSVPLGYQFRLHNPNPAGGTTYYTINGADPRQVGGTLDPAAQVAATSTVAASTILTAGQTWKWLLPSAAPANDAASAVWTAPTYTDDAWASGTAPLGYGEASGLATNIAPTAPNYTSATGEPGPAYFRTTFTATDVTGLTSATFEICADDGAVIYLNGVEAARFNFPLAPTPATYGQEALGPIDPGNNYAPIESTYFPVSFDPKLLREGVNTIAVEVHQATYSFPPNATNAYPRNDFSDMRFDVRIIGQTASGPGAPIALATNGVHTVRTRIKQGDTWSPLTEATFVMEAVPASAANLVVSELHYHPPDPTPAELAAGFNNGNDFEFIELMNISRTQSVDLSGVKLDDAVTFDFGAAPPALRILPPGGRVVVAENPAAFAARTEPGAQPIVAGAFSGNLSNSSEQLIVRAANGTIIKQFTYRDSSPWPEEADGNGSSLVLNAPFTNPNHNLASSWHASPPVAPAKVAASPAAPQIAAQPAAQTVLVGGSAALAVSATSAGFAWYQWMKDGVPIEGATKATLTLGSAAAATPGNYTVVVANAGGATVSAPARLAVVSASALANLSVRTTLAAGQELTVGAVVSGGSKQVLIRAAGPALTAFGLAGMADPRLELFTGGNSSPVTTNDDWPGSLAGAFAAVGAFPFASGSKDAALAQPLTGAFTVRASGSTAGAVLVEVYDTAGGLTPRLVNVSARNRVGTGDDILIAGFSIAGTGGKQLLIRAVGPTLASFGVPGPLSDPTLRVIDGQGATVGANDNWAAALAAVFAQVGAFPLVAGSRDSALLVTLPAGGTFTIQVAGANNGTGEALIEIYEVL